MQGVVLDLGFALPGRLAPVTDVVVVVVLLNLAVLLWVLQKRAIASAYAAGREHSTRWGDALDRAWVDVDGDADVSTESEDGGGDDVDESAVRGDASASDDRNSAAAPVPSKPALPPRAKCTACKAGIAESDLWARCLGCGSHHHTLCLGEVGACAECGNPIADPAGDEG